MNRPIKFRAWDGRRMLTNCSNLMLDASHGIPYWQFGFEEPKPMDDTILMQFTGLLDKNGKEIYEGDVVKARLMAGDNQTYDYSIGFDKGTFTVNGYPMSTYDEYETIGNIYENPELIK